MVIIELKEAAYDSAFELLDKAKHYSKKTKMTLCALEDAIYECYEASKDDDEEHYEDNEDYETSDNEAEESDMDFRRIRRGMRHHEDDEHRYGYRRYGRRGMRMRRDRLGRFA